MQIVHVRRRVAELGGDGARLITEGYSTVQEPVTPDSTIPFLCGSLGGQASILNEHLILSAFMMNQSSFSDAQFASKKKLTRRERFLAEIEEATSWPALAMLLTGWERAPDQQFIDELPMLKPIDVAVCPSTTAEGLLRDECIGIDQ